jgi:LPS-assembly protein
MPRLCWAVVLPLGVLMVLPSGKAVAQGNPLLGGSAGSPVSRDQPVTFTADSVEYDRERGIVTATGHVEAWQNDHVLRADKITFDRNTNVAAATGNVVLLQPDGQVMFSDYAELSEGMRNGVVTGMRAILAQNGKLAANGARRTEGKINELSKVVYTVCNLCAEDPTRPPLWQVRALSAVQDVEHKRIEYQDATLEMFGVPVAYMPYFWHPDPSVKRQSGILVPTLGTTSHLGQFYAQPYYWVLDDQSDTTITPMITTRSGPQVDVGYRRRFNDGSLTVNGSLGYLDNSAQATLFASGRFNYDEQWRYGFDLERASSSDYVRDFRLVNVLGDPDILTSQVYLEGFGEGAYSRLDTKFYQGLNDVIVSSKLPFVLPRYQYSYFGEPDDWGGRLKLNAGAFNVLRTDGTNTQRANLTMDYERPFIGYFGDSWKLTLHGDAAGYNATDLNQQPNYSPISSDSVARALPQVALDYRWPLIRDGGDWGSQVIEPIAQLLVAPRAGESQLTRIPNEDSLDFEFTDQNLFGFNRFPGIDRMEGGVRANVAMHGAWYLGGTSFDALIGQSYRTEPDNLFPVASGLHGPVSDVVGRVTFAPTEWFDVTYRTRLDHATFETRMADALASVGGPKFRLTGGYIYTTFNPYQFYDQPPPPPTNNSTGFYTPRDEVTLGASTAWDRYRLSGYARRDLSTNQMVTVGVDAAYEDECFIFDIRFNRRYTSYNGDNGSTAVLFQLTFKTIGQFGFRAL